MRRAAYALLPARSGSRLAGRCLAAELGCGSGDRRLDAAAGAAVVLIAAVTALPAFVLRLGRAPRMALILAAAFPLLFLLLFVAALVAMP